MTHQSAAVTGRTRLFVVIGDPIDQIRAPELMNPIFARMGRDAIMVPLRVAHDQLDTLLPALLRSPNLDGVLVTIPHKFAVCRHMAKTSLNVDRAGCANALRRGESGWEADNFDGIGFVQGLGASRFDPAGKRVLIAGAGGAGASIAAALTQAGPRSIDLYDLQRDRSHSLAGRLASEAIEVRAIDSLAGALDYDLVVNATPLGLAPSDPLPIDVDRLSGGTLVADVIMKPRETELLRQARKRGLDTHFGSHMLDAQIEMYCRFFGVSSQNNTEKAIGA